MKTLNVLTSAVPGDLVVFDDNLILVLSVHKHWWGPMWKTVHFIKCDGTISFIDTWAIATDVAIKQ